MGLKRELRVIDIFSLALGAIIGWGCFVLPGTDFLPQAAVSQHRLCAKACLAKRQSSHPTCPCTPVKHCNWSCICARRKNRQYW